MFVIWSRLYCPTDARSHNDCNLFATDIDKPLTAICFEEVTFPLFLLGFMGRRVILVPHETK